MIGIRADGNNKIGLGHIMRCLTIAKALKKQGEDAVFILADAHCRDLVAENGFRYCILNSKYDVMEDEAEQLISVIKEHGIKKLLLDSYFVTSLYLQELRREVTTFYLDDVNAFEYPVDAVINYNVFADAKQYPYALAPDAEKGCNAGKTSLLAGPCYAPVREEFGICYKGAAAEVKDIFLSLGGSDAFNLSAKIVTSLRKKLDCNIHVVCGPFNIYKEELRALAKGESGVYVHENVKEMWLLMQQCDLAISAAGSTMYELSVAGLPVVTFSFVENQRKIAEGFDREGAGISVGHYQPETEEEFMERLIYCVNTLVNDKKMREELSDRAVALVDGKGAGRIAKAVIEYKR